MTDFDQDQLFHDLEQRYLLLRKDYDHVIADRDIWKDKSTTLQTTVAEFKSTISDLSKKLESQDAIIVKRDEYILKLQQSIDSANENYARKSDENERLRSELKMNAEELIAMQNKMKDFQISLSDSQNQLLPLQYEVSKLQQDKQFLEERLKIAEAELQGKVRLLLDEKSVNSNRKLEQESKISELTTEVELLRARLKSSQDQVTNQNEKITSYLNKTREIESEKLTHLEMYTKEIDALKRVIDLEKRNFNEATEAIIKLEGNIASLKESNARSLSQQRQEFQTHIESLEIQHMQEIEKLSLKINEFESKQSKYRLIESIGDDGLDENMIAAGDSVSTMKYISKYGLSVTELFDRVVTLERLNKQEEEKRKEVEVYLNRVLKEMEVKAPIVSAQKRDYQRLLESHEYLIKQYEDLISQNSILHEKFLKMEKSKNQSASTVSALEQHNKDLSQQIQHLLKSQMSASLGTPHKKSITVIPSYSDNSTTSVISEYLVSFDNIEELQVRNAQLLQTIRKLEKDLELNESLEVKASESGEALQLALKEIQSLRESRQRTEDLVQSLIQQKDMYKAMVENSSDAFAAINNRRLSIGSNALTHVGEISPRTPSSQFLFNSQLETPGLLNSPSTPRARASGLINDLQLKLSQSEEEKTKLSEQNEKLREVESLLNDNITKLKTEATNLRMESVRFNAESRFQTERISQLEESLKLAKTENSLGLQRRLDIERIIVEQQHDNRLKDEAARQLSEQINKLQEKSRHDEIEIEILKSSENRLKDQINSLREEMKRQASLTESVHRIEISLSSRIEEEKNLLKLERDNLLKSIETLKTSNNDLLSTTQSQLIEVETKYMETKEKYQDTLIELNQLKTDLVRERDASKSSYERNQLLEKQLLTAQERLFSVQSQHMSSNTVFPSKGVDSASDSASAAADYVSSQILIEKEMELEQANIRIDSLRSQLIILETSIEQYKSINKATEKTLSDLQSKSKEINQAYEVESKEYADQIETLQREIQSLKSNSMVSVQETNELYEKLNDLTKESTEVQVKLQDEINIMKIQNLEYLNQIEVLKQDAIKFQSVAKASHANYEHELQLHAASERNLSQLQSSFDILSIKFNESIADINNLKVDFACKEKLFLAEKKQLLDSIDAEKVKANELGNINDLLHSQIQGLVQQVDKLQTMKSKVEDSISVNVPGEDSAESLSLVQELVASNPETNEEVAKLNQTISEMREVIRFMKRERDMQEAKLNVSDIELSRHLSTIATLHKQLDELRAEINQTKIRSSASASVTDTNGTVTISTEEYSKLQSEIQQLPLLRDSNSHLRQENDDLNKRLNVLEVDLKSWQDKNKPLVEKLRQIEIEKQILENNMKSIEADGNYWRERLHNLISRYNEVDPEEYRLLQRQVKELQDNLLESKKQIDAQAFTIAEFNSKIDLKVTEQTKIQEEYEIKLKSKADELDRQVKSYETLDKNTNTLRTKLRELKAKYDENLKNLVVKSKAETELKNQVTTLTDQVNTGAKLLSEALAKVNTSETIGVSEVAVAVLDVASPATGVVVDTEPKVVDSSVTEIVDQSKSVSVISAVVTTEAAPGTSAVSRKRTLSTSASPEVTAPASSNQMDIVSEPIIVTEIVERASAVAPTQVPVVSESEQKLKEQLLRKRALSSVNKSQVSSALTSQVAIASDPSSVPAVKVDEAPAGVSSKEEGEEAEDAEHPAPKKPKTTEISSEFMVVVESTLQAAENSKELVEEETKLTPTESNITEPPIVASIREPAGEVVQYSSSQLGAGSMFGAGPAGKVPVFGTSTLLSGFATSQGVVSKSIFGTGTVLSSGSGHSAAAGGIFGAVKSVGASTSSVTANVPSFLSSSNTSSSGLAFGSNAGNLSSFSALATGATTAGMLPFGSAFVQHQQPILAVQQESVRNDSMVEETVVGNVESDQMLPEEDNEQVTMLDSSEEVKVDTLYPLNTDNSSSSASSVFISLRPPSPSNASGVNIPVFGFGKGSLPKPALLNTSGSNASAVRSLFARQPPSNSIFNAPDQSKVALDVLPFSSPINNSEESSSIDITSTSQFSKNVLQRVETEEGEEKDETLIDAVAEDGEVLESIDTVNNPAISGVDTAADKLKPVVKSVGRGKALSKGATTATTGNKPLVGRKTLPKVAVTTGNSGDSTEVPVTVSSSAVFPNPSLAPPVATGTAATAITLQQRKELRAQRFSSEFTGAQDTTNVAPSIDTSPVAPTKPIAPAPVISTPVKAVGGRTAKAKLGSLVRNQQQIKASKQSSDNSANENDNNAGGNADETN